MNYYRTLNEGLDRYVERELREDNEEVLDEGIFDNIKDKVDVIIAIIHFGIEFTNNPNNEQIELANYLNTTQSVIADYERGRYLISTPFLYTICKKYNISADYLLGRIDTNTLKKRYN